MDNKELNEILQKYAESTKSDRETAFKKLDRHSNETKRTKKKVKPKYIFATAMCAIIIALCIALPITLTDNGSPQNNGPRYCDSADLIYRKEESISVLINNYHIDAKYPTEEAVSVELISSKTDSELKGAQLGYYIFEDAVIDINIVIVPKNYILEHYEAYFTFPNQEQWKEFKLRINKSFNLETESYDVKIYFADSKYDYFVFASSDEEVSASRLLDILYA